MTENYQPQVSSKYNAIAEATISEGFSMASDKLTGSLLCTLAASKPKAKLLEFGTGTGLSTSCILEGMDEDSSLISIDNDEKFLAIARQFLSDDKRLQLICTDGEDWINQNKHERFDFIFADTWHGKYLLLDETLSMLKVGGLYIVDDMLPQPNWPEGHAAKAEKLIETLEKRTDLSITQLNWSTGIIIAAKR